MDNQPLDDQNLFEYTLRSLGARDQTSTEISRKLARRGATEEQCARIIERLIRVGLLSDSEYAERFVERRGTTRGKMLLGMELRRKGIDPAHVLAERSDDADTDAATHTLRRRIGSKPVPADRDERQKLSAYLARRGFNYSAIRAAWQRVDSSDDLDWLETPESDE